MTVPMPAHFRSASRACAIAAANVILAIASGACGDDGTSPLQPLAVTVTETRNVPLIFGQPDGSMVISCDYTLQAEATGGGRAVWEDAVVRWRAGTVNLIPLDTQIVSRDDMRSLWGRDTIASGQPSTMRVQLSAAFPFQADFVMRYRNLKTGEIKSAQTTLACAPDVGTGPLDPLAITQLVISPAGAPQPGDDLLVRYTAKSGVGVWATKIVITGAIDTSQVFAESAQPTVTHEVAIHMPAGARLGEPIEVTVYALDADVRETRATAQTLAVVDTRAPTLTAGMREPYYGTVGPLAGDFAEGDSIHLAVTASDNRQLRWLVYELTGGAIVRDSVAIADSAVRNFAIEVPVPPGLTDNPKLTVYARDLTGLVSPSATSANGAITTYPMVDRVTRIGAFDGDVTDIVIDDNSEQMFVAQRKERRISIVSMSSLGVVGEIALPSSPWSLDLTTSGDSLVVALFDQRALGIIDLTRSDHPLTILPLATDTTSDRGRPQYVRVAANGKAIVMLNGGRSAPTAQVMEVDLATATQRMRPDATAMEGGAISRTGDRSVVVLIGTRWSGNYGTGCGYRYVAATDTFLGCGSSSNSGDLSAATDGSLYLNGYALLSEDLGFLRSLTVTNYANIVGVLAPDARNAYLVGRGSLIKVRTPDGTIVNRTRLPLSGRTIVTPDGETLLVIQTTWHDGLPLANSLAAVSLP